MPKTQVGRVQPNVLQADVDAVRGLKMIHDYHPTNPDYSLEAVAALLQRMLDAEEAEVQAQATLSAARDATVAAQWAFHNAVLGVKGQVKALYGEDSDQVATIGLKKKSDRKSRSRSGKPPTTN